MKRKIFITLLCALLSISSLSACKGSSSEEASSDAVMTTEIETTTEETTTEETTEPEPEGIMNPLTGIYDFSQAAVGKRPVAVMVNNIYDAMPQYGTSSADIVFELPVEGMQTRLMCLYGDYTAVPYIVSVRSFRYYFAPIACGFDAFYVHWGKDESVSDYYYSLDWDTFDGINGSVLFGRDQGRLNQGYNLEHTSYFDGTLFKDYVESNNYRTDLYEEYTQSNAFNFTERFDDIVLPSGDDCSYIEVNYGGQSMSMTYDPESAKYYKYNGSDAQIDASNGKQLSFTNVFVLETSVWTREDGLHKGLDWTGGNGAYGYYFSQGKVQKIYWSKAGEYSRLRFYDENGDELVVNRGKSYVTFCPYDSLYFE